MSALADMNAGTANEAISAVINPTERHGRTTQRHQTTTLVTTRVTTRSVLQVWSTPHLTLFPGSSRSMAQRASAPTR